MGELFEPFIQRSPLSVMARLAIEKALDPAALDALFTRTAAEQQTRLLLFSTTVDLLSLVVCGRAEYVSQAYHQLQQQVPVALSNVYEKLKRLEPKVSAEMVRFVSAECQAVIHEMGGARPPVLPGYRVKILDGNCLAGTHKKVAALRTVAAAALPGKTLAVYDPALDQILTVIPCEDGHAQERALLPEIHRLVEPKDVWVADRNLCVIDFLKAIAGRAGFFVIRRHKQVTVASDVEWGQEVETDRGWVSERTATVLRDGQAELSVRIIRVRLKTPTRDKETVVEIITNLPPEVAATTVAEIY